MHPHTHKINKCKKYLTQLMIPKWENKTNKTTIIIWKGWLTPVIPAFQKVRLEITGLDQYGLHSNFQTSHVCMTLSQLKKKKDKGCSSAAECLRVEGLGPSQQLIDGHVDAGAQSQGHLQLQSEPEDSLRYLRPSH